VRSVTVAAATYRGVASYRNSAVGKSHRRRGVYGNAAVALGSASAAAMMAGTATVAAAWMVASTLRNPELRASAPFPLEMASFPRPQMRLADPTDMFGGALASANPVYAPDAPHQAKMASAEAPASASADVPLPAIKPTVEARVTRSVPLPRSRPFQMAQIEMKQIEAKPGIARVASVPAAPSPRVAASDQASVALARAAQALHQTDNHPPVYSLASAAVAPPLTTGSIGGATKPATAGSLGAAAKPAGPALAYANPDAPVRDNHTAIYDIVAHTVYMPDGERLEAHSGLGRFLDDPHYASQKARGPTPPNTYDLTLRSGSFHGVQAIRLNPVSDSKMFGRDGILAHTYMLGPSGQSFGCVSFKHYDAFLRAFQRGEVSRMVVVPHLQEPPPGVRAEADDGERYASAGESDY
jgi:hypothetical protein